MFTIKSRIYYCTLIIPPANKVWRRVYRNHPVRPSVGPSVRPFVRPSVRPSGYRYMVCLAISSYSFRATALIFCRTFIHIMEVSIPQDFDFHQIFSKWQVVGLTHFVRPSGYRYMVCPAISSYSFGATALILCRMFIHAMEVCMSTGFWFSSNILKMTGSWTFFRTSCIKETWFVRLTPPTVLELQL
jgi:hypothetical protein